jgi:hypothetical protein
MWTGGGIPWQQTLPVLRSAWAWNCSAWVEPAVIDRALIKPKWCTCTKCGQEEESSDNRLCQCQALPGHGTVPHGWSQQLLIGPWSNQNDVSAYLCYFLRMAKKMGFHVSVSPPCRTVNTVMDCHATRGIFVFTAWPNHQFHYNNMVIAERTSGMADTTSITWCRFMKYSVRSLRIIFNFCQGTFILTGYELDDRGIWVQVLVRSRIFSSSCCPDWFWGSPILLYNGYQGLFLRG